MASELVGVALRVHISARRDFGGTFATIFRLAGVEQGNGYRDIHSHADDICRLVLHAGVCRQIISIGGGEHGSSIIAGRIFVYGCRVDIPVYAVSMRGVRRKYSSDIEHTRQKFLLHIFISPANDNLFGVGVRKARLADDCTQHDYILRADDFDNAGDWSYLEKACQSARVVIKCLYE